MVKKERWMDGWIDHGWIYHVISCIYERDLVIRVVMIKQLFVMSVVGSDGLRGVSILLNGDCSLHPMMMEY
jgi:hypothetical protein